MRILPKINHALLSSDPGNLKQNKGKHDVNAILPPIKHYVDKKNPHYVKSAKIFLTFLSAVSVMNFLAEQYTKHLEVDDVTRTQAEKKIGRVMNIYCFKLRKRFVKLSVITKKYALLWKINFRCRKKRKAAAVLALFLTDLNSYRFPVMLAQLRLAAIKLQRYIKGFCRITEARHKALSTLWSRLEKHYNSTLIPYLQEKLERQRKKKLRNRTEDSGSDSPKSSKTDRAVVFFPSLTQGVNQASYQMAKLMATMQKGERLIQRCPPEVIFKNIVQCNKADILQKKKEAISQFLHEIRICHKMSGTMEAMRKERESTTMTLEDAKNMIRSSDSRGSGIELEILFPRKHKKIKHMHLMKVYTGEPYLKFQRLVEEAVCAEHGLAARDLDERLR